MNASERSRGSEEVMEKCRETDGGQHSKRMKMGVMRTFLQKREGVVTYRSGERQLQSCG